MTKQEYDEIMDDLKTVFKDVQYNKDLRPLEKWAFQKGVMECKKTLEKYNPDRYDEDMGCTMSSLDKGYACPLNEEQEAK